MDLNACGHRLIQSASNPVIKRAKSLRDKKYRRLEGHFLAEGLRILAEARDAGVLPQQLFYADDREPHPLSEALIAATMASGGEVIATSTDILARLSGKDNPQTLIGIYPDQLRELIHIDRASAPIWLVVQAMRDPGNLGTIMRTGDAVGAGGVILIDDCVDPFSVETVRASMGAIFTQVIATARWPDFIAWLRGGPGTLVGTSLAQGSVDYRQPDYPVPTFIVTGNEARGLPPEYEAECDILVKMPMLGRADSLNAAVATAVMAYQVLDKQGGG
ncbi:MAG: RNA methyltransferase [Pseudomonadota bacterium]